MKRRYSMPFGSECRDDGSVRFRLWAPTARQVDVCPTGPHESVRIAMDHCDGGWFELITDAARSGSQYHFRIDGEREVSDPASRFQPRDVHGPSEVIDPFAFEWRDQTWRGRRWEEAVIYELHVGSFTPAGTFSAVGERLDDLADLGITAVELMPVADFPGKRNWGYDGVFPFAPDSIYGRPEDLKELVQSAHAHGIMAFLDVVYNHFGPEGNYLRSYAPQFFTDRHRTPWGDGINFDGPESRGVRDFFIHNALYWLTEYHFDGLRLDAVHTIIDDSTPHILTELADAARSSIEPDRHVHLILENDLNQARYLKREEHCQPKWYAAQWNDDVHHALHVLTTGELDGYYSDYSERALDQLGRCLVAGFAYQGEASAYRNGKPRGESTAGLPLTAFVSFLQNHDQIGNRAFGERIIKLADRRAVRAATAILLLAPSPPLLFMGEEFGAETPFLFFCDFEKDLAAAVTEGRRNEFSHFARFADPAKRERIPDPNAEATFEASRLDWSVTAEPRHELWLRCYRDLLKLRSQYVVPRLSMTCAVSANYEVKARRGLRACWRFPDDSELILMANLGVDRLSGLTPPASQVIYASQEVSDSTLREGTLPPWSVVWFLQS
ncbi:MAG TPA: malto-oligosyltrehalose trehalohydrolase [Terriglobales bacterium]|jgi:maltooligosyltrehalose trehalohydrolase|nr:malto-oligosyltrehalose trehalohydrolase [Terriglobales bacterium]